MTDFELNKAIAEASGWRLKVNFSLNKSSKSKVYLLFDEFPNGKHTPYTFDFNSWSDLMPLVEEHRLIIVPYKDDLWEAYPESGEFVLYNKKYLRAGAECLLKYLQGEQANE